jgi:hypothetical protein
MARHWRDYDHRYWDRSPRWQTPVVRAAMGRALKWHVPPDELVRLEIFLTRLLGQPLSLGAWDRMTFNDKVTYRRLFSRDARFAVFSDKLRVRDHIAERLGDEALPRLLRVSEDVSSFADLDGPFVLKASHGSMWVILVPEGRRLTEREMETARSWLSVDMGGESRQWAYRMAQRLLFAEEMLAPEAPPDYKFFVFDGRPEVVQVDLHRFTGHRRALFRPDWAPIGALQVPLPDELPPPPPNLQTMLEWASVLADGLDFLRVDLYDLGTRVVVGELTCYPGAGKNRFRPGRLDLWLGGMWPAPGETRGRLDDLLDGVGDVADRP